MTWKKATLVLVFAVLFDLVRIFFEFFWFLGPALVGAYCTVKVGNVWVVGKLLATGCVAAAAAGGAAVSAMTTSFGVIMAIAVGLLGWMTLGFVLMSTNARILKTPGNALWLIASLGIAEIPFIGVIPSFTLALWRMYRTQIKREKSVHTKWARENAAALRQERDQQAARLLQYQAAQVTQAENEATNDERFNQEQAANDANNEIPEEVRRRA